MCMIIYKPKNIAFNIKKIKDGWYLNSDGAGYGVLTKNGIFIKKGIMKLEELLDEISIINKHYLYQDIVLHLRAVSSGIKDKIFTHPFILSPGKEIVMQRWTDQPVLFHNGTICSIGNSIESDTYHLAKILGRIWEKCKNKDNIKDILKLINDKFVVIFPNEIWIHRLTKSKDGCYYTCYYTNEYTF